MPHPHGWWGYHTVGWWVWVSATLLLGVALWWTRGRHRTAMPWFFLGLFLASVVLHYLRSNWGFYVYNRPVWLSGVASIIAVSLVPLLVCVVAELALRRVLTRPAMRVAVAAGAGILVIFLTQVWIYGQGILFGLWLQRR